ncbi:MAG TPA: hypothetical protein VK752_11680 [Bryobacteraceae bacterium]|jgi:uncharacterized protein (TIGR03437 family)|nr:hypothetical protein [Bryobacteraceae bacterium]
MVSPRISLLLSSLVSCAAFGQTYTISTIAGSAPQANVSGTSAILGGRVLGVAPDPSGNVYFSAQDSIMRWAAATGVLTLAVGNGTAGFSGDSGPAASAQVSDPQGVAVDSSGNLYIADATNHRIRKVSSGTITTIAGNGTAGFTGDNGPATSAELNGPIGIAVDSSGNLYIADSGNNRVRKVTNGTITTIAGNGTAGFTGDNSGNGATNAELNDPVGVAVDSSGNVYVADYANNRIRKISNGVITTVAGNGTTGFTGDNGQASTAGVYEPRGVAVDSAGNVYIADSHNYRVRKVTVSTGVISTVAGNGTPGYSGDNGPATTAQLRYPVSVSLDSAGNLYIADLGASVIRKVSSGTITTLAGTGSAGFAGDTGPATSALLDQPNGITLDSAGNLYIADYLNARIREISSGVITTVAGDSILGFAGDNGAALSAELDDPVGAAVDSSGNVYITDEANNRIRKVSSGVITTVVGTGKAGYVDNVAATSGELNDPLGIAVDSSGNLYIADRSNNRVRKVSGGIITTVAGTGTQGSGGDNGPATSANLNLPAAVAVDSSGNLYISEAGGNRIRKVSNGTITTIAGTGKAGYSGDNGPATSAQLNDPIGIALDSAGNIYVADHTNYVIRKISNGVITTIAGSNVAGLSGDGGSATTAQLDNPYGITVAANGNVYFSDAANNRIRMLTPVAGSACAYSISPTSAQVPAAGGNFTVTIQTTAACSWTVTGLPSWITIPGATSGTGSGSVTLVAAPNTATAALSATLTIAGVSFAVTQAPATGTVGPSSTITSVSTASGGSNIAQNTFIVIKGTNLVPANTPAAGIIWSSAPSFANGQMPTQLGSVSVTVNGNPAYIYFYCSAATSTVCTSDQINVLTPLDNTIGSVSIVVTSATSAGTTASSPFSANMAAVSPAFLLFGSSSYVAATHLNYSLIGPAGLYPGSSTPAAPGEQVVIYAVGFGLPTTPLVAGSATQSGSLPALPVCTVGSNAATVAFAGVISPGLYQLNLIIPAATSNGDQSIACLYGGTATPSGDLITVN